MTTAYHGSVVESSTMYVRLTRSLWLMYPLSKPAGMTINEWMKSFVLFFVFVVVTILLHYRCFYIFGIWWCGSWKVSIPTWSFILTHKAYYSSFLDKTLCAFGYSLILYTGKGYTVDSSSQNKHFLSMTFCWFLLRLYRVFYL